MSPRPYYSPFVTPPPLQNPDPTADPPPPFTSTGDRFIDGMITGFNTSVSNVDPTPPTGFTERKSLTYSSTGNPCLDLFFHVVPNTTSDSINTRLYRAWSHNPLTTLKLICNLRGVRGTGKSDKEGFYAAAFWLHKNHPKTFACNVTSFAKFGYFKDFPEILYRLLESLNVRRDQNAEWRSKKGKKLSHRNNFGRRGPRAPFAVRKNKRAKGNNYKAIKSLVPREVRILNEAERARIEKEDASAARHEKYVAMANKFYHMYTHDPEYRFLYERITDMFADILIADLGSLKVNELNKISLAAKWCPSIDSSFDRSTLLCESIAKKVFPREKYNEYDSLDDSHYVYRVRDRLRKEVLVPLRKALELPEIYMGASQWGSVPYNRVASVAMKLYKDKFVKHDAERFAAYLEEVKSGKAKIAAGALLPHQIVASSLNSFSDGGLVAELQHGITKKRKLKSCLPICDVSSNMAGAPMEMCLTLGLLVSELNEEPWKGKVVTFSDDPKMHIVEGDTVKRKMDFIKKMEQGRNADFQKVFDLILQVAVKGKLREDEMIKKVMVFSDMEFGQHDRTRNLETDYQVIQRKFTEKGYGSVVPQIVFWNLRDSKATPVASRQDGVALVSGFSKNLLALVLDDAETLNPEAVMQAAISGEEYNKLVVLD